ncbi:MAG: hypothetical protein JNK72_25035 [Myxococcales bacterium]|nr:hypothetical protein [Myxococcales bacterium]
MTASAPRERPILFSDVMVRALLDGTKTAKRRLVTDVPAWAASATTDEYGTTFSSYDAGRSTFIRNRYGVRGDRLWVKEVWLQEKDGAVWKDKADPALPIVYRADLSPAEAKTKGPWRTSLFLFRWGSRITLEVTDVRIERLHAITDEEWPIVQPSRLSGERSTAMPHGTVTCGCGALPSVASRLPDARAACSRRHPTSRHPSSRAATRSLGGRVMHNENESGFDAIVGGLKPTEDTDSPPTPGDVRRRIEGGTRAIYQKQIAAMSEPEVRVLAYELACQVERKEAALVALTSAGFGHVAVVEKSDHRLVICTHDNEKSLAHEVGRWLTGHNLNLHQESLLGLGRLDALDVKEGQGWPSEGITGPGRWTSWDRFAWRRLADGEAPEDASDALAEVATPDDAFAAMQAAGRWLADGLQAVPQAIYREIVRGYDDALREHLDQIKGRALLPTREEARAHAVAGGHWMIAKGQGKPFGVDLATDEDRDAVEKLVARFGEGTLRVWAMTREWEVTHWPEPPATDGNEDEPIRLNAEGLALFAKAEEDIRAGRGTPLGDAVRAHVESVRGPVAPASTTGCEGCDDLDCYCQEAP